jgi:hypothetical protein
MSKHNIPTGLTQAAKTLREARDTQRRMASHRGAQSAALHHINRTTLTKQFLNGLIKKLKNMNAGKDNNPVTSKYIAFLEELNAGEFPEEISEAIDKVVNKVVSAKNKRLSSFWRLGRTVNVLTREEDYKLIIGPTELILEAAIPDVWREMDMAKKERILHTIQFHLKPALEILNNIRY